MRSIGSDFHRAGAVAALVRKLYQRERWSEHQQHNPRSGLHHVRLFDAFAAMATIANFIGSYNDAFDGELMSTELKSCCCVPSANYPSFAVRKANLGG